MLSKLLKVMLPAPEHALAGRAEPMPIKNQHFGNGHPIQAPFPAGLSQVIFALGCFWGAERKFWTVPGVYTTAVGYIAGITPNPSYEEVCSGLTGHTEAVLVVFDAQVLSFEELLAVFWEAHNPTQGMRQGNDIGTQYRSGIYTHADDHLILAEASRAHYQLRLTQAGYPDISTEIQSAGTFYYAEDYHQQYLAKNPDGYCGLGGCAVAYQGN